jgi:hypothetical protein
MSAAGRKRKSGLEIIPKDAPSHIPNTFLQGEREKYGMLCRARGGENRRRACKSRAFVVTGGKKLTKEETAHT